MLLPKGVSWHGRLRSRRRGRRHQRHRDCPRRRRPRAARAAGRAERPCLRHLLGLHQADPRGAALPRTRLVPPGARGADRARGDAAHGAASHLADALRAAAGAWPARAVADPDRAVHLRPSRRARDSPRDPHDRSRARSARRAAQAPRGARVRIFGLLGGRRSARGAQCPRRRRPRCRGAPAYALCRCRAPRRLDADARCKRPARCRHRARSGQCDRAVARAICRDRAARTADRASPPRQGQPYRGAAAVRT